MLVAPFLGHNMCCFYLANLLVEIVFEKSSDGIKISTRKCLSNASMSAFETIVDDGLHASFNACNIVAHWIKTSLCGVDLDDMFELSFTSGKLIFPVNALGFALFNHEWLGVLAFFQHLVNIGRFVHMWRESFLISGPSWCEPSGDSSSHFIYLLF